MAKKITFTIEEQPDHSATVSMAVEGIEDLDKELRPKVARYVKRTRKIIEECVNDLGSFHAPETPAE